jgi:hypothetical protein
MNLTIYFFASALSEQQHLPLKDRKTNNAPIIVSAILAHETFNHANKMTKAAKIVLHQHVFIVNLLLIV